MTLGIFESIAACAQAATAWFNSQDIRERRALRHEERQLQDEILAASDAGNESLQLRLQNQLTEVQRDRQALQPPASPTGDKGK